MADLDLAKFLEGTWYSQQQVRPAFATYIQENKFNCNFEQIIAKTSGLCCSSSHQQLHLWANFWHHNNTIWCCLQVLTKTFKADMLNCVK